MNLRMRIGGGLAVLAVAGTGMAAGHRWAGQHVRYFTHSEPQTLNCIACHEVAYDGSLRDRVSHPVYPTPVDVAVAPDGGLLYVAAEDTQQLLVVRLDRRQVEAAVDLPGRPQRLVLNAAGDTAFVSLNAPDGVAEVDLRARKVVRTFAAGESPVGLAVAPDGQRLFVANWASDDVSVIDLAAGREVTRLAAGRGPQGLAVTRDGRELVVANQLAWSAAYPQAPAGELTVIDIARAVVTRRIRIPDVSLVEGVGILPDGTALVAVVQTRNLVPALQVARGWIMSSAVALVDLGRGTVQQVPLDEMNAYFADPGAVRTTPDGRVALVAHSGADVVTLLDPARLRSLLAATPASARDRLARDLGASGQFVTRRLPTGPEPTGMAISPDGRFAYVADRLGDSITVLDLQRGQPAGAIPLGGPAYQTTRRRGERLFTSGAGSFQGQFSCRSCHPRLHADNLQYDLEPDGLGRNVINNRSLLGVRGTGPFKWNGKNTSLYMQDGFRFATFLTRTEPFGMDDQVALAAFLQSLQPEQVFRAASPSDLTAGRRRGEALFERTRTTDGRAIPAGNRCVTCHPAPLYTDRRTHEIGSQGPTDTGRAFDTAHLRGVRHSAPYLHDGRAATLEEIWTRFNPHDTHGVTNDLTKQEFNDLIEFVKGL